MTINKNLNTTSDLRSTANQIDVGVNAVSLGAIASHYAAFSDSEKTYYSSMNPQYKLPSFLFGFILFLAAVTKVTAVLFKNTFKLINVILEIAPRGILFLLSLINLVFSHCSLASSEWLMQSKDEEDCSHFCSNDLPLFPLYVQQNLNFYES